MLGTTTEAALSRRACSAMGSRPTELRVNSNDSLNSIRKSIQEAFGGDNRPLRDVRALTV
jgi:hypothetical protein